MPTPPGDLDYFDKVNYVIDAWCQPCEAPWYIYIETLKPALLKAFITLATFGWDDVARGYARPRGLGRRTGKKRRKGKPRSRPSFPELGELLGKNIPGAYELKGEQWSRLGKTLWRIDTAMQMVMFYWLVADVLIDLSYDWTSVLYETVWCQASPLGRFSWSQPAMVGKSGGFWWNVAFPDLDYQTVPPTWAYIKGFSGSRGCKAGAAVSFQAFPGFAAPTQTGVRLKEFGGPGVFAQSGPGAARSDGSAEMPLSGDIPPDKIWLVQSWHDADVAYVGNAVTFATQSAE